MVPTPKPEIWCAGGTELVALLRDTYGKSNVYVRTPYHIQVGNDSGRHNIWIDSANIVKYRLADQAGRAQLANSQEELLRALAGHQESDSDLAEMRRALELTELISAAKKALPLSGLTRAVFVDAGVDGERAQIAMVRVSLEADGEHVQAESHPIESTTSTEAEKSAIEFALQRAQPDDVIFCDNQSAVHQFQKVHGDRVRWLQRNHNKAADRVANLRTKTKKRRRRKKKPK